MSSKRLFTLLVLIIALGAIAYSQTIRNANNSMLATINSNGEVRNSNNSLIARISNNGDIRDSNGHLIARLDGCTVRNSNNTVLGLGSSSSCLSFTGINSKKQLLGSIT